MSQLYLRLIVVFSASRNTQIFAKPKESIAREEATLETRFLMRTVRRLNPVQKDNFAINEMSFLLNSADEIISKINLVGWIIGGFSLLIGAFGIANIMFVSVKERTNIIGIQKAMGAKKYIILSQFLSEAAVLSIIGGIIGILIVFLLMLIIGSIGFLPMVMSVENIVTGLVVSLFVGIISGYVPALTAARLSPVEAINSN